MPDTLTTAIPVPSPAPRWQPDASMALLTDLLSERGDDAYAAAARRTSDKTVAAAAGSRRSTAFGVAVAAIGVLFAVAAVNQHAPAPAASSAHDALVSQVRDRTAATDQLQRQVGALRQEVRRQRSEALQQEGGAALASQITALEAQTGAAEVTGPGLVVSIDDRQAAPDQRLQDREMQAVVNALWAAGATDIAINGRRLTGLSAIRSAAQAILVDYRPLVAPYDLTVLGTSAQLEQRFTAGPGQTLLRGLDAAYNVRSTIRAEREVHLPAAGGITLRWATSPSSAPSASSSGRAGPTS